MTVNSKVIHVDATIQNVTPSVVGHVNQIPKIHRYNLLHSNPHRLGVLINNPNNNDTYVDDDNLFFGRNRKHLEKINDIGISDYAKFRLFFARMKALEAFRKTQI